MTSDDLVAQKTKAAKETLRRWRWHPETMVREQFGVEPDDWQLEVLRLFPHNQRIAMKACKGPGKTATLAWLIWNFLATRPCCRIGALSVTGANLHSNLWPELALWQSKSPFLLRTFRMTSADITHTDPRFTKIWWCQARTYQQSADKEAQALALAGLHADYAMAVLDESGGIPQPVMVTAEQVLASGIECKVVQSGNPTHTTGPLYTACTSQRHLWKVVTITGDPDDPRRSPRISKQHAQEQIDLYASLGQFTKRTPKVDEVMTLDVLKATDAGRPRIG